MAQLGDFTVGTSVEVTGTFRNTSGVLTNPTTVTMRYKDPSGNIASVVQADLENPSTGVWTGSIPTDEAGTWFYEFEGTGTADVVGWSSFTVSRSKVSS